MTPDDAESIYSDVLPVWYLRSVGAENEGRAAVRDCRCHWGRCGWCHLGRPERCAHRQGRPLASPTYDTFLLGRTGGVLAEVRRPGRPCAWRCPGPAPVDEPLGQLELFALAGGAR